MQVRRPDGVVERYTARSILLLYEELFRDVWRRGYQLIGLRRKKALRVRVAPDRRDMGIERLLYVALNKILQNQKVLFEWQNPLLFWEADVSLLKALRSRRSGGSKTQKVGVMNQFRIAKRRAAFLYETRRVAIRRMPLAPPFV